MVTERDREPAKVADTERLSWWTAEHRFMVSPIGAVFGVERVTPKTVLLRQRPELSLRRYKVELAAETYCLARDRRFVPRAREAVLAVAQEVDRRKAEVDRRAASYLDRMEECCSQALAAVVRDLAPAAALLAASDLPGPDDPEGWQCLIGRHLVVLERGAEACLLERQTARRLLAVCQDTGRRVWLDKTALRDGDLAGAPDAAGGHLLRYAVLPDCRQATAVARGVAAKSDELHRRRGETVRPRVIDYRAGAYDRCRRQGVAILEEMLGDDPDIRPACRLGQTSAAIRD
ncbi:hypothetical protein CKO28_01070 [Rhodovibrio sodomensis]|uniref:Uncharacterized protein n=1 Tax=Rhodovibrio sodomensis TaxID=1088 RepID=A0ABS1D9D1_9PROT|nr:hypothetical protein [Rhodovibrio sodomensis]MBK1666634.1 hypothetical protein [Rhodovibrio sodomensis]